MAIFKCKMCGGSLELNGDSGVATCEYCGSVQTLPKKNDDVIANLFNRANNLRIKCEFDKAAEIYEKIINEDNTEAEAYWGLVLCKYGIEYVEDPKTYKRVPTCHRTQYESILSDVDFIATIENTDDARKSVYQEEAEKISALQKDILAIVSKEKPFDVFICYKETDENGKRTVDSTLANDIYYQLTQEGMKVFYAATTLEDKLGQEYEPYIFAALNSAKVMLVVGTKPEYFEAVWVKNEWSRYLKLMKSDRSKLLIPCYRDMDAYDLPEEFSHLQAQDMSKIGFVNDVVRGIKKVVSEKKNAGAVKDTVVVTSANDSNTKPLLKRAFMFLEDGDFTSADEYCEKVLDINPECAEAYLGKLMAELNVGKIENIKDYSQPFGLNINYQKIMRFGDEKLKAEINGYNDFIIERNRKAYFEEMYEKGVSIMGNADSEQSYFEAAAIFKEISDYEDAAELEKTCIERAEDENKKSVYEEAIICMDSNTKSSYKEAISKFRSISDWQDSEDKIKQCEQKIVELGAQTEKRKKIYIKIAAVAAALAVVVFLIVKFVVPPINYSSAQKLLAEGEYEKAYSKFYSVKGYKDSAEILKDFIAVCSEKNGTKYEYDEKGNLIKITYPEGDAIEYVYDDKGNPTKIVSCFDNSEKLIENTYDKDGNLIRKYSFDEKESNPASITDYVYDDKGNVILISDAYGYSSVDLLSCSYNESGQMTESKSATELTQFDFCKFYVNDENGKVLKEINFGYDDGQTVCDYKYDKNGNLVKKSWVYENSSGEDEVGTATYNSNGDLLKEVHGDYVVENNKYVYNAKNQLVEKTDKNGHKIVYQYNGKGQLVSETTSYGEGDEKHTFKTVYTYDSEGRLIKEAESHTFTQDAMYMYDIKVSDKRKVTETDTIEYTYDKNGRVIKEVITDQELAREPQLLIEDDVNTIEILYEYNVEGKLIKKTRAYEVTNYYYDANGYLMGEYSVDFDEVYKYTYDKDGNCVQKESSGKTYTYEYDSKGNVVKETETIGEAQFERTYDYDKNGHLLKMTEYDDYGNQTDNSYVCSGYKVFYSPKK